jgi:hypothetical protein
MNSVFETRTTSRVPEAPESIEETGIGLNGLLRILMKAMYVHGAELESELADIMKIGRNIVKDLLDEARTQQMVETKGSACSTRPALSRWSKPKARPAPASKPRFVMA